MKDDNQEMLVVKVSSKFKEKLQRIAESEERTLSQFVRYNLAEAVNHKTKKENTNASLPTPPRQQTITRI